MPFNPPPNQLWHLWRYAPYNPGTGLVIRMWVRIR